MSLLTAFNISAGGLAVQRERIEITSQNLANASSTRTPEGGPYQRRAVVISSEPISQSSFDSSLENNLNASNVQSARVVGVVKDGTPPKMIFDPHHPDANPQGYVATPDINVTQELIDVLSASKAYEANVTVLNASKTMVLKTLEIGA